MMCKAQVIRGLPPTGTEQLNLGTSYYQLYLTPTEDIQKIKELGLKKF